MKLLAIDGNSVLNRAFYGVRMLTAKDGTPTNALFGFLNILLKLKKEYEPDGIAIAFDVSKKTFRHKQYDDYKATRKGMPDELRTQLPLIKEILEYLGYTIAVAEEYEGDDVLGTLAKACKDGNSCIVATGDRDCLQLIDDNVSICYLKTKGNILYDNNVFAEEYELNPSQIIDLKALMGDASDNIPGVKGVGEKTALTLIKENENIQNIYDNLDDIKATPRVKKLLTESKDMAFLSYELATICTTAPIDTDYEKYIINEGNTEKLVEILTRLELFSFFEKFSISPTSSEAKSKNSVTIDFTVNNDITPHLDSNVKSIFILYNQDYIKLISINEKEYIISILENNDVNLNKLFSCKKAIITFCAKSLYKKAYSLGYEKFNVKYDMELACYLLNPSTKEYNLESLTLKYLYDFNFNIDTEYHDIACLPFLYDILVKEIKTEKMTSLYKDIELPLCKVLALMEQEGFQIDREHLTTFGEHVFDSIELTRKGIYDLAGEEFNVNSTKELGNILFEKLGLPAGKKTKTGYSTNVDVLESLYDKHEIIPLIMEYRKLAKLHSTYVVGLLKVIGEDGRVHSTFNQTETRTGRISSTEPNVQNIPVRTELGSEMRRFFVAREGYTLIDADYSQIELRILAHIADDKVMQQAFTENIDIHALTASQVFNHPLEDLPSELRSRAKAINFGIVYGISAFSLSKDINVSVADAKAYITSYLDKFSGVKQYMEDVVVKARADGYVSTLYGRQRDLADINSTNKMTRAFAERVALNMPIQGTAADIIKLAMNKVASRIEKEGLEARLILQVHDELIVEAPTFQAEYIKDLVKFEMENAANLSVPLLVDVHIGENWYIAKG